MAAPLVLGRRSLVPDPTLFLESTLHGGFVSSAVGRIEQSPVRK